MTRFDELLRVLTAAQVEFVVIGGVAAVAHGSPRLTSDMDIVYGRNAENLERVIAALGSHRPYLRGAPPGLPFRFDVETLRAGLNFTLVTDLGSIDLLGEVAGGGGYKDLLTHSIAANMYGVDCRILDLETLIHTKRAAGRPKDFEAIAELELLRERSKRANS